MQTELNLSWDFTGISELMDDEIFDQRTSEYSYLLQYKESIRDCVSYLVDQAGQDFAFSVWLTEDNNSSMSHIYLSSHILQEKPELMVMYAVSRTDYD